MTPAPMAPMTPMTPAVEHMVPTTPANEHSPAAKRPRLGDAATPGLSGDDDEAAKALAVRKAEMLRKMQAVETGLGGGSSTGSSGSEVHPPAVPSTSPGTGGGGASMAAPPTGASSAQVGAPPAKGGFNPGPAP